MEYPTLITAGTRWLAPPRVRPRGRGRARGRPSVLVRAGGDQRVRARVDGRGVQHFLDRAGDRAVLRRPTIRRSATSAASSPGRSRTSRSRRATDGNRLAGYRAAPHADAPTRPPSATGPARPEPITYNKTALWLNTLERMIGWDTLQRILSTYFSRYEFRHPGPEDFFAVANEVSGRDLNWFFDRVYRSSAAFDYAIDVFSSSPDVTRGYVGDGDRRRSAPPPVRTFPHRGRRPPLRRWRVPRRRACVLENGEEVRWRWEGDERWKPSRLTAGACRVRAGRSRAHPPARSRTSRTTPRADRRYRSCRGAQMVAHWLIWLQDHLLTYGFFV